MGICPVFCLQFFSLAQLYHHRFTTTNKLSFSLSRFWVFSKRKLFPLLNDRKVKDSILSTKSHLPFFFAFQVFIFSLSEAIPSSSMMLLNHWNFGAFLFSYSKHVNSKFTYIFPSILNFLNY